MAKTKQISEMTTEELAGNLIIRKHLRDYFRRSKNSIFWDNAVAVVEEELRKRGALK